MKRQQHLILLPQWVWSIGIEIESEILHFSPLRISAQLPWQLGTAEKQNRRNKVHPVRNKTSAPLATRLVDNLSVVIPSKTEPNAVLSSLFHIILSMPKLPQALLQPLSLPIRYCAVSFNCFLVASLCSKYRWPALRLRGACQMTRTRKQQNDETLLLYGVFPSTPLQLVTGSHRVLNAAQ